MKLLVKAILKNNEGKVAAVVRSKIDLGRIFDRPNPLSTVPDDLNGILIEIVSQLIKPVILEAAPEEAPEKAPEKAPEEASEPIKK